MVAKIIKGNCLDTLRDMADNSVDSVVTDPPYGLAKEPPISEVLGCWLAGEPWKATGRGFMGKEWDSCVPGPEYWREVFRVLKPGGHACIFAGSRTVDLMGMAARLAGFEIRDQLQWLYGSGFPKSLNIGKALSKAAGAERGVVSIRKKLQSYGANDVYGDGPDKGGVQEITAPAADAAKQWDGWGTALKPAHEPIILARKPLVGTVANNVLEHGTGGINVDGCRVATTPEDLAKLQASTAAVIAKGGKRGESWKNSSDLSGANPVPDAGRWPANVMLDEEAGAILDGQSGNRPGMSGGGKHKPGAQAGMFGAIDCEHTARGDSGGASRFFYCAKSSRAEREAGLEDFEAIPPTEVTGRKPGSAGQNNPRAGMTGGTGRRNTHPTVKPLSLMRWLVRLVTPPGGLVLDPFCGSGSTGCAASQEGFDFIGCELSEEYCRIAEARIEHWARDK